MGDTTVKALKGIDLKFRNSTLQFVSDDEDKLKSLAEIINSKVGKISNPSSNVSDLKLCYTLCLKLEDELDVLKAELSDVKANGDKETIDAALGTSIEQVADYINGLADRFENK